MNSSCLAFLMLTPSTAFLVFLPGGLPSISVWIEGIEGEGEGNEKKQEKKTTHTHKRVYLFEDGLSVFKSCVEENRESGEREKDREKRSFRSDQRGCFVKGNCTVLLL